MCVSLSRPVGMTIERLRAPYSHRTISPLRGREPYCPSINHLPRAAVGFFLRAACYISLMEGLTVRLSSPPVYLYSFYRA